MKNFIKRIKEDKSFIVPWLVLGLSIIIFASGLTYAFFDFTINSENQSSLKVTGTNFDVTLDADAIDLDNLGPIYDEYADEQAEEFSFEVENNSRKVSACYSLSVGISEIDPALISSDFKWKLVNSTTGEVLGAGNFSAASRPDIDLAFGITIGAGETDNYVLKVWISYSDTSNQNSMQNTSFTGNIIVNAVGGNCIRNAKLDNVRYIKDCVNGSTASTNNHWVELQAIYNGTNVAYGKTATGTVSQNASYPYSKITDGDITSVNYSQASVSDSLQCITVDLTQTYNLDEIAVWHYWGDGRTYYSNTMYVSSDNSTWTPVIANSSAETSEGKRVSAYDASDTVIPIYRLTNLVTNGSFENGTNNWNYSTSISISSNQKKFGNNSARNLNGGQYSTINKGTYSYPTDLITVTADHIYYASVWIYLVNAGSGVCYSDITLIYNSTNNWFASIGNSGGIYNTWKKLSNRVTIPSVTTPKLTIATAGYSQTDSIIDCYSDGVFVINLTEIFGAGKEPTKAWCDTNLNYFDGSQNLYLLP